METIGSREFQTNYQRLSVPVVVKAKSRTLGTWYPRGTEPHDPPLRMMVEKTGTISTVAGGPLEDPVDTGTLGLEEEVRQLKRQLAQAHRAEEREYGTLPPSAPAKGSGTFTVHKPATNVRADSSFHPVPKPGVKK